ncbi:helix-turn-helix domain-containing protein [Hyphomicrobiales bacterium]|nr:helix-turn-helix domain-containing protein [Hyphomicrobiales bacterium]MDB9926653.1 helix-turn-helix domain-containing protein [Hyphomicrobiales bacterium]
MDKQLETEIYKILEKLSQTKNRLLSRTEVATLVGKSSATIQRWESEGLFPKSKRPNNKCKAMYRESEVNAWIKSNA